MPSEKKRINLTVPEDVYEKLQEYKEKTFISSDATACLQLIAKQLDGWEASTKLIRTLKKLPEDDLHRVFMEGMQEIKAIPD